MKVNIIGATGLVGKEILLKALKTQEIEKVTAFVRRSTGVKHPKLVEQIIDFEDTSWLPELTGDVLFSALGTTLQDAGSKEAQYRIDHDYQYQVAKAAAHNGVKSYVLISSINASPRSRFFYLRMKGELEEHVKQLEFQSITILQPGPLVGVRTHPRVSEKISLGLLSLLPNALQVGALRPVTASTVAEKCIEYALKSLPGIFTTVPLQSSP